MSQCEREKQQRTIMEEGEELPRKLPFVLLTIAAFLCLFPLCVTGDDGDASIMYKLSKSISPTPSGWSGTDHCKWSGVTCDSSGRVSSISLSSKQLTGELPSDLSKLSNLKTLSLQKNQLSGPLPALGNHKALEEVYLDNNNFTSMPSSFFGGIPSLQSFSISMNLNLPPWSIPSTLSDSTMLNSFDATNANLAGTIPDIFGAFSNLQTLRLSYNNLTGSLPQSFATSGIRTLWLNNQATGLSGKIDVISSMSQLSQVWLNSNKFSGSIPDLSRCTSLADLQLRDNELTGLIPNMMSLPKLANVSLQNNRFQGPYPEFPKDVQVNLGKTNSFCNSSPGPCDRQVTVLLAVAGDLGYPMTLAKSWEGNDACRGWNFITCDNKGAVTVINFGKQGFSGQISPAISNLTSLRNLLLNDNHLTGSIPPSLTGLTQLQLLDVSNNNLSGKIPTFPKSVTVKTHGNPSIGKDLPSGGWTDPSAKSRAGAIVGSIIVVIFVAVLLFILYKRYGKIVYKRFWKNQRWKYIWVRSPSTGSEAKKDGVGSHVKLYGAIGSDLPSQSSGNSSDLHLFDAGNATIPIEVLREATNNFSEHNFLGKGGFGVVYRGQLLDGTEIAVKRMESSVVTNTKGLSEFQAEIAVLTKVRHRNLVAMHGFCVTETEKLLVYEYMSQGTLSQHLFECNGMGLSPLTWKQRVTIALDVARGVDYLHNLAQQSFIHRDLKSSNILLGDGMRAKVSDFGLVKNAPSGNYSVETRLAGTFGYLAPEYAVTGRVTTKVDVYAYGVVVMELITGRRALDETLPDEKCHLVTWFRKVLANRDRIRASIDPSLNPDEETFESICKVVELAGHCTAREPYQRPDMGHAVNVLSPLVEEWKPTSADEEDSFGLSLDMSLPQALQKWQAVTEGGSMGTTGLYNSYASTGTPQQP